MENLDQFKVKVGAEHLSQVWLAMLLKDIGLVFSIQVNWTEQNKNG